MKLAARDSNNVHPRGLPYPRMLCNYCENQARGTCRFCGAGMCRDHMRATRFISGFEYVAGEGYLSDYVAVDNAMWCGRCAVRFVRNHP